MMTRDICGIRRLPGGRLQRVLSTESVCRNQWATWEKTGKTVGEYEKLVTCTADWANDLVSVLEHEEKLRCHKIILLRMGIFFSEATGNSRTFDEFAATVWQYLRTLGISRANPFFQ